MINSGFLLKVGNDSTDVQVGSLIALLAESGEDWKSVQSSQVSQSDVKQDTPQSSTISPAPNQAQLEHASKRSL